MNSGSADQNPIVLCQLKSRAFGESPRWKNTRLATARGAQLRGHQR